LKKPSAASCVSKAAIVLACVSVFSTPPSLFGQTGKHETLADILDKNHYQVEVKDGRLTGAGASVLESALSDAQFVLLGEDHGIAQIPQFDAAVCALLGPKGFHDLAIEVGPAAAEQLQKRITAGDGRTQLAAFDKEFPETIAFYTWSEEFDFLSACAHAAAGGRFRLWGLDQELMGSSRLLLTHILEQHLSPDAAKEGKHLIAENDGDRARAAQTGNPFDLFMVSAPGQELAHFRETLAHDGNPGLARMLDSLLQSREIYQKYQDGRGYESNRQRALLMKSNFIQNYGTTGEDDANPPKVILKFGGEHMFRGFNPLHNNDIGNFVAELAEYQHSKSVHILLLGVKGKQLRFAGIGRPSEPGAFNIAEDKDSDFLYLKPMFDKTASDGLTLFDLRAFRPHFGSLGTVDREMERLIFGYDFLVLIPNAISSQGIQ